MAFSDDFSSYPQNQPYKDGDTFGYWTCVFAGYGAAKVIAKDDGSPALSLAPKVSTTDDETHSVLVTGPSYKGTVNFSAGITTAQQLRQNEAPKDWEVAWIVWHVADADHFYYFMIKPLGWELGKRDPSGKDGQIFLKTGEDLTLTIGQRYQIDIQQTVATMTVSVDGNQIVQYTDDDNHYESGKIGFYVEDAQALYDTVSSSGP